MTICGSRDDKMWVRTRARALVACRPLPACLAGAQGWQLQAASMVHSNQGPGFISVGAVSHRWLAAPFLRLFWLLVVTCCRACALSARTAYAIVNAAFWFPRVVVSSLCLCLQETEKRNPYSVRVVVSGMLWVCLHLRALALLVSGIVLAVLRRWSVATRRRNSSLRSHRTRRSQWRRVFSGLNKTMYAPVGPNSRCRGLQKANPAEPGASLQEKQSQLGRIKTMSRSPTRRDVFAEARRRKDSARL
jgi:hypothetical protein